MNPASQSEKILAEDRENLANSSLLANITMTPEERIHAHENALKLMLELQSAGEKARAKSK